MSSPETAVLPDEAALLEALTSFVAQHPSQRVAAEHLGISAVYLSDVLNGRRPVGGMAARLGYAGVTVYVPLNGPAMSNGLVAQIVGNVRAAMGKAGVA